MPSNIKEKNVVASGNVVLCLFISPNLMHRERERERLELINVYLILQL